MSELGLIQRAAAFADRVAIEVGDRKHAYGELLAASARVASCLLSGSDDLNEARVAFLMPPGFGYAATQWGIWRAGGVAVPLSTSSPEAELDYVLGDAQVSHAITTSAWSDRLERLCEQRAIRLLTFEGAADAMLGRLPAIERPRRAMILYTSGTTSKPKGVVTTHANIEAQIESLVEAWEWRADDRIPLFLPLHHVHGILNVLCCALWSGAAVEAFASFDLRQVLDRCAQRRYTLFMAVPTIYVKLIAAIEEADDAQRKAWLAGFASMRLMVSGSAALPASVHRRWAELTGQPLLERYGMTEIGMALSNPLHGERRAGTVGRPLPRVEVRLRSESGRLFSHENEPGEIVVRGPTVFREYWNRPEATEASFHDGWFRTGDMAIIEDGYWRILGRASIDIIKSGGYKLSALEIEATLLEHPAIRECAVVGIADDTWGEVVAAAIVPRDAATLEMDELQSWCAERLANYKVPRLLRAVDRLPRNAMGKVTKPAVRNLFS